MLITTKRVYRLVLTLQACIWAAIAFGDIGFDHPGRFGMAFGSFLILLALQAALIAVGLVVPHGRLPGRLLVQGGVIGSTILAVVIGESF